METARRMLVYVGLGGFDRRSFGELSGGERQLCLFAKTLVQETDTLLLDEPTSNLDIKHQDRIFSMAAELAREGRLVVSAVHNLNAAAAYCSRLVLLESGMIRAEGRPEAVIRPVLLEEAYGVRTSVGINTATGTPTVTVLPERWRGEGPRVHLIGGAGSAVNLTRELYRLGFRLSGGIAHSQDSDELVWESLDIPRCVVGAFSRIEEGDIEKARRLMADADLTVLCPFPVGTGNVGNLRLAGEAKKLVVLKPGPDDSPRSYFSPEAERLFLELLDAAPALTYAELIDRALSGAIFA
jgi:iron complex transport system ATP-binding protein